MLYILNEIAYLKSLNGSLYMERKSFEPMAIELKK